MDVVLPAGLRQRDHHCRVVTVDRAEHRLLRRGPPGHHAGLGLPGGTFPQRGHDAREGVVGGPDAGSHAMSSAWR